MCPLVSAVLLNWNGYEHTSTCLASLAEASYPNLNIIVVDNGSKDASVEQLRELVRDRPAINLLENPENLGFARGCNVGIRYAYELGADYILLINNDSTAAPGFLEPAVKAAENDPSVGLVSGKIYLGRGGSELWYAGGNIDLLKGSVTVAGFRETDRGQYDQCRTIGFVTGALMLIKRSVIDSIGPLPEEYFFGQEEWDYSLAAQRAGFRLLYVPQFVTYHLSDGSHSNADPRFVYNSYRNKLIFQQKYLPRTLWPLWLGVFSIYSRSSARWQLQRAHAKKAEADDLLFALKKAISDHRKEGIRILTEADLQHFSVMLQAHKDRV